MKIAAILLMLTLSGCALLTPKPEIQIVRVPVAVECPRPEVVVAPVLPIISEEDMQKADLILRLQASSFETISAYAQQLENVIKVYQQGLEKVKKDLEDKMKEAQKK